MKLKKAFQRREKKYLIDPNSFPAFQNELQQSMQMDEYGLHTISSLYYDTDDFRFIRHSMEKPMYKEKFRVRSYGVANADSLIFLELKKKIQKIVYKRRIAIPYSAYQSWLTTGVFPKDDSHPQITEELKWLFLQHADLQPKVLILYDRLSYFWAEDADFRLTFDQNIRYRKQDFRLDGACDGELVAPEIGILMEVKALGAYPLWFVQLLNKYRIKRASFSKYAQTYQRHLWTRKEKSDV